MHSGETRSLCAFKRVSTDTQMVSVFRLCCSQKRPGFADGLHWISCQGQPQGPHQPLHRSSPAAQDSGFSSSWRDKGLLRTRLALKGPSSWIPPGLSPKFPVCLKEFEVRGILPERSWKGSIIPGPYHPSACGGRQTGLLPVRRRAQLQPLVAQRS